MTASTATGVADNGHAAAFEFVKALAFELSAGKIDLPSFPDVAVRVRRALGDDRTTVEQITRIVGSEPALAARLLKMSNSAMLNRTGKQVTDLKSAIARMGYNMVRSAAISFAMAQIRASANLKSVEQPLKELWQHSTYVAALSYVVAKKQTKINPDEAFLAGLLHGIGKLYILSRCEKHPVLFAAEEALGQVIRDWHANVGKAIMENWEMAPSLTEAIGDQEDIERTHEGSADLTDVVICANMMAAYFDHPADLELNMQGVNAFRMLSLDAASTTAIISECREEIEALRNALG
jgi:HD-like signal output (HDOD) protein